MPDNRISFSDASKRYPDSWIGFMDVKRDADDHNGVIIKVSKEKQEVVDAIILIRGDSNTALIEGADLLDVDRIGGVIFG